ncbi:MAG: FG-GAP repeat protein [Planctomycetes bacterium]|nr:FG-GAP repeat protein [Planctomycetota bacterium]
MSRIARLVSLSVGGLVLALPRASAQAPEPFKLDSVFTGFQAGDASGAAIISAGDVNADGFDDVLVGMPGASPNGLAGAGSALLFSGRGGSLLVRFNGDRAGGGFGAALAVIPDANNDGVVDFLIGAPLTAEPGLPEAGKVFRISGIDGSIIDVLTSDQDHGHFGAALAVPGDLNGDGVVDYLVGAPGAPVGGLAGAGKVFGVSGADRSRLFTVRGAEMGEALGSSLAGLPGIGVGPTPSFAIGSPGATVGNLVLAGHVQIFRGLASLALQINGAEAGAHFGTSLGRAGDINGDRSPELLVGAPDASPRGVIAAGSAFVMNPTSGLLLLRIDGAAAGQHLGVTVTGVSDVSEDGTPDIAAGSSGNASLPGGIGIYSGASGSVVYERTGGTSDGTGTALAVAGDVDGDGHIDIAYGEPAWRTGSGDAVGRAVVLMWDRSTLSVAGQPRRGERLAFTLGSDPGAFYVLILSTRGAPGARLTPIQYPNAPGNAIALDVGLEHVNVSFTLPHFIGDLDASGRRVVSLRIPTFETPPLPVTFQAQFITLGGAASPIKRVSNSVQLTITQ